MVAGPEEVNFFHQNSDCDSRAEAQHHTLGLGSYQAMPGGILSGRKITGSRANTAAIQAQIITLLKEFGVVDGTTA